MKIAKVVALALALLPAAVITTASSDASACGMAVRMEPTLQKPTPVQDIASAEKLLEGGQNVAAARKVLTQFPSIRSATAGANPLETRGLRVFALAIARSSGALTEKSMGLAGADWTTNANLAWSVQALREIDQKRPNDPAVQADLGEALSKVASSEGEAMTILAKLEKKDLMGSPFAYAALARLREKSGDSSGAQAASKRCEEMSKTPGVCKPSAPSAPAAKPVVAAKA